MEIKVLKEDKDLIEIEVSGEGNTLCDALRSELLNSEDTSFASYSLKHPLVGTPVLSLKVKKGKPKKALVDAAEALKAKNKELRSQLSKLQ